ncbi:hypothetical protein JCM11491_006920 [Sporobolomyces phaffii]
MATDPCRRRAGWLLIASLLSLSTSFPRTAASVGDRSPAYHRCVSSCLASECADSGSGSGSDSGAPPSAYRPSFLWTCPATCSYACQQTLTDLALSSATTSELEGLPRGRQVQFHGKWPFHRLDWSHLAFPLSLVDWFVPRVQEPLSVLFSLANLYEHARGYSALDSLAHRGRTVEGRRLAAVYRAYSLTGLFAWTASVAFHTRDLPWTERLDYFGAGLTTLAGLWIAVIRLAGWHHAPASPAAPSTTRRRRRAWTAACALAYCAHVAYLVACHARFDYTYNLRANVAVSLATIAAWLAWTRVQSTLPTPSNFSRRQLSAYPSARTRFRAPHHLDPVVPLVALPALALLEVFDFAPVGLGTGWRLLDAHAVWHLSTVLVVRSWYRFLTRDVRWIDGQGDPPTAANAAPGDGSGRRRTKDTPAAGGGVQVRGFDAVESRRGNLKDGMVGFGLGVLDKYGLGLGRTRGGGGGTGGKLRTGGGHGDGATGIHGSDNKP